MKIESSTRGLVIGRRRVSMGIGMAGKFVLAFREIEKLFKLGQGLVVNVALEIDNT